VVEFRNPSAARNAISTLQDTELMGRLIFLREDREAALVAPPRGVVAVGGIAQRSGALMGRGNGVGGGGRSVSFGGGGGVIGGARSVFCGNLAYEVQWQDLKDHMRQAGQVLHADVFMNSDGRSKGCGVVEYSRPFE
ncbi:unnamed protein product, partial [Discosporangium mesarthrocarpum]